MDRAGLRERAGRRPADGRRRPTSGPTAISTPVSRRPRSSSTKPSSCSRPVTSRWSRAARWPTGRTASCICTARRRAWRGPSIRWRAGSAIDASNIVLVSEYCGGGFGSKGAGAISMVIPALLSKKAGAPVMMRISREEEHYIGRARTGHGRPGQGRVHAGRPHHRARSLHRRGQRIVRADGRLPIGGAGGVADLAADRDAVARARGADQHAAALAAALARADAGERDHGAGRHQGGEASWGSTRSRSAGSIRPRARRSTARSGRTASAGTSPARS